jgi:hypothetical protein
MTGGFNVLRVPQVDRLAAVFPDCPWADTGGASKRDRTGALRIDPRRRQGLHGRHPTAFADVTAARFGTSGYNILRGPGLFNWDFGILREFVLSGRSRLQFRLESFNFTNTPHLATPDNNVGDGADFMTITSVQDLGREGIDERQFRLGLRIVF